jgi:hypothetical protein
MAGTSLMTPFQGQGQGYIMVKVGCQRNPYFLSSFNQINSKLGVKVAYGLPLSLLLFGGRSALTFMGFAAGQNLLTRRSNFEIEGTMRYHIV